MGFETDKPGPQFTHRVRHQVYTMAAIFNCSQPPGQDGFPPGWNIELRRRAGKSYSLIRIAQGIRLYCPWRWQSATGHEPAQRIAGCGPANPPQNPPAVRVANTPESSKPESKKARGWSG